MRPIRTIIEFLRDPGAWLKRRREQQHYRLMDKARAIGRRWAEAAILEGVDPEHLSAIAKLRLEKEHNVYEREHLEAARVFASEVKHMYAERDHYGRIIKR